MQQNDRHRVSQTLVARGRRHAAATSRAAATVPGAAASPPARTSPGGRTASRGALALMLVVGVLAPLALGAAPARAVTIPPEFFTVLDQHGANDVPGQSDLTQMGRDESDVSASKFFWSWDSIDLWTGTGQTGDACALYDTDADGKINFVICAQINNPGSAPGEVRQTVGSPYVFTCGDNQPDRCTQKTEPVPYTSAQVKAGTLVPSGNPNPTGNLITNTDPFPFGSNFPNDSTIELVVLKAFLAEKAPGAVFVNVCSYPSAANGGNNNPFDCIAAPSSGFLVIKKDAGTDTTTSFPFTVSPVPTGVPGTYTIVGSGQTNPISVAIGNAQTVTENVPAGWSLTNASCTKQDGTPTGTFSAANKNVTGLTIESGKVTTCTFTDVKKPTATVQKDNDANHDGTFADTETVGGTAAYPYTVTYRLTITNGGAFPATISTITDDKVSGSLTSASTSDTDCATVIGTSIAAGTTRTCFYDAVFASAATAQVVNTASVTLTNSGGADTKTDTSTVNLTQRRSLAIEKSSTTTTVTSAGQVVPYSYLVTNTGNVTLTGVTVTDDKVASVSCPQTTLAPGVSTTCTGSHTVTQAEIDAGGDLVNIAVAHSGTTDSPPDSVSIPITSTRNLTLAKTASKTSVVAGNEIVYTLTYANTGNATARTVTIEERVPDGTSYVSCTGGCTVSGGTVTWSFPSVAPGAAPASVTLTVSVSPTIDACSICNTATIKSPDQAGGAPINSNQVCVAASPAADPSTANASGDAYGLKAYVPLLSVPLVNAKFSEVASTQTGLGQASDNDSLASLHLGGVLGLSTIARADLLKSTSASQVTTATGARQTSTAEVLGLNLLDGLVTADVVRSVASTRAGGDASSYSAAGTTATNLRVLGASVTDLTPGARIRLDGNVVNRALWGKGSYVAVNEQAGTTSGPTSGQLAGGTYKADLTVAMIRVYVTGGTLGGLLTLGGPPVELTVAKATAHSEHKQTRLCSATSPTKAVSGHAFIASALLNPLLPPTTVGFVNIPASGGAANMGVMAAVLPTDGSVVTTTDAASDSTGTNGATSSTATSSAQAAGVCVLRAVDPNCLIRATLLRSQSNSTASATSRSSNANGTTFTNLYVAGIPISANVAPNTTITLPLGLGFVVLNEQVPDGPETGHTGLTVRAIRVKVTGPLSPLIGAEVIVAEAHSDALWR